MFLRPISYRADTVSALFVATYAQTSEYPPIDSQNKTYIPLFSLKISDFEDDVNIPQIVVVWMKPNDLKENNLSKSSFVIRCYRKQDKVVRTIYGSKMFFPFGLEETNDVKSLGETFLRFNNSQKEFNITFPSLFLKPLREDIVFSYIKDSNKWIINLGGPKQNEKNI